MHSEVTSEFFVGIFLPHNNDPIRPAKIYLSNGLQIVKKIIEHVNRISCEYGFIYISFNMAIISEQKQEALVLFFLNKTVAMQLPISNKQYFIQIQKIKILIPLWLSHSKVDIIIIL